MIIIKKNFLLLMSPKAKKIFKTGNNKKTINNTLVGFTGRPAIRALLVFNHFSGFGDGALFGF